jgi:hypothetical protein
MISTIRLVRGSTRTGRSFKPRLKWAPLISRVHRMTTTRVMSRSLNLRRVSFAMSEDGNSLPIRSAGTRTRALRKFRKPGRTADMQVARNKGEAWWRKKTSQRNGRVRSRKSVPAHRRPKSSERKDYLPEKRETGEAIKKQGAKYAVRERR